MDKTEYTALAERLGSQLHGIDCDVVIPILVTMLTEVAVQSGTPREIFLGYINSVVNDAYNQFSRPSNAPIQ